MPIYASIPYFSSRFHNSTHQVERQAPFSHRISILSKGGRRGCWETTTPHTHLHYSLFLPFFLPYTLHHLHSRQLLEYLNFSSTRMMKVGPLLLTLKIPFETNYRTEWMHLNQAFTYSLAPYVSTWYLEKPRRWIYQICANGSQSNGKVGGF